MTNFTPAAELKVVDGMILSIEQTLAEFDDPYTKSELYRELSAYHARKASLVLAIPESTEAHTSVNDELDGIRPEDLPEHSGSDVFEAVETPVEEVAEHATESTVDIDDDPNLPTVAPSFYETVHSDTLSEDENDEDEYQAAEALSSGTAGAPPAAYNVDLVPNGASSFDTSELDEVPNVNSVKDEDDEEFNRIIQESEAEAESN